MTTDQEFAGMSKPSTWHPIDPPRPLNTWERQMIDLLLSQPKACMDEVPGSAMVRRQLHSARVDEACSCCLSIGIVVDHAPANQMPGGPSGFYTDLGGDDVDGMSMWAILFTKDGYLVELEVQRADGTPFRLEPDPRLFYDGMSENS